MNKTLHRQVIAGCLMFAFVIVLALLSWSWIARLIMVTAGAAIGLWLAKTEEG